MGSRRQLGWSAPSPRSWTGSRARRQTSSRGYQRKASGTPGSSAAHEAEICAYWAQQLAYLKSNPGQPFGRTAEDPDRVKYIEDHKNDPLDDLISTIRLSADQAAAALRAFNDDEWSRITGIHSRRGVMDMDFISNLFLAGHAEEHLKQLDETLAAAAR